MTAAENLHEATRKRALRREVTGIQSSLVADLTSFCPFSKRKRRTNLCIHRVLQVEPASRVEESGDHLPVD